MPPGVGRFIRRTRARAKWKIGKKKNRFDQTVRRKSLKKPVCAGYKRAIHNRRTINRATVLTYNCRSIRRVPAVGVQIEWQTEKSPTRIQLRLVRRGSLTTRFRNQIRLRAEGRKKKKIRVGVSVETFSVWKAITRSRGVREWTKTRVRCVRSPFNIPRFDRFRESGGKI